MEIMIGNKLRINVGVVGNTATISLGGNFSFSAHREFKSAYRNQLSNSSIGNIVINLAAVEYLDSSALGMLLVMRDNVQLANKSLVLASPSSITQRTFDIAGFEQLFTIV
jgi:anti-anti-sigma factor